MIELFGADLLGVQIFLTVILLAFFCELLDSTLGMGYGTTLTPVLMLFGFGPLAIIPCVLLSELITGITAGFAHHKAGNVNFKRGSIHLKIALVLATCSIIGATIAVFVAINIPKLWLKTYIGLIVLGMGMLFFCQKKYDKSLKSGIFLVPNRSRLILKSRWTKNLFDPLTKAISFLCG